MPRNGQGVYSLPPNTAGVSGQTIASGKYNTLTNDIANDLNAARPVTAGGTGATNAADALANLGGVGAGNFLEAYSIGDFYDTARTLDATWLRRDGDLYDSDDYPELATLLPDLPDGFLWEPGSVATTQSLTSVNYGDGQFVTVGGSGVIAVSTDRINWTLRDSTVSYLLRGMAYGAGIFVIAANSSSILKSTDADTWGAQVVGSGSAYSSVHYDGTNFFLGGAGGGTLKMFYSSDANTWNTSTITSDASAIKGFANNNAIAVAVSSAGKVYSSVNNGQTWTLRTSGVASGLNAVIWDDTLLLFIAVGDNGVITTSTNGIDWFPRTSGTSAALNAVSASSAGVVAGGANGTVVISSNGTSWSSLATGFSFAINGIESDPTDSQFFVFVGTGGNIQQGTRTLASQFRVPNDNPTYGWIRALEELP